MCIRHKWRAFKLQEYNLVKRWSSILTPEQMDEMMPPRFGGTNLKFVCTKCGKLKYKNYPGEHLTVDDFKGTKIGEMLAEDKEEQDDGSRDTK